MHYRWVAMRSRTVHHRLVDEWEVCTTGGLMIENCTTGELMSENRTTGRLMREKCVLQVSR